MAQEILIIGQSGTGKTTSIRNLNPKETAIINPAGKALPIKGFKSKYPVYSKENQTGNLFNVDDSKSIIQILEYLNEKRPEIKNIIIDDGNYIMALEYFRKANEKGFDKFTSIATGYANIIMTGKNLRNDINFIMFMHPETDTDALGNKIVKSKTVGKLIDNQLLIEGFFSIVLYTKVIKDEKDGFKYVFVTQNDGSNTGKSPMGMFKDLEIDNDLKYVIEKIEEFNK